MSDDQLGSARSMFLRHSCSKERLFRDGLLETYNAYHVTKDQEYEWIAEFVNATIDLIENKNKIPAQYAHCVAILKGDEFIGLFDRLLKSVDEKFYEYDTLSKVWTFQPLLDISDGAERALVRTASKKFMTSHLDALDQLSITLDSGRYSDGEIPVSLNSEAKLKSRIERIRKRLAEE